MAVLVTAIHAYGWRKEGVDDRPSPLMTIRRNLFSSNVI
jgi:hypothetical protein